MKHSIIKSSLLLSALCAMAISMKAQIVQENELAVVYYMPKTQVVIDLNYTEETFEPGPFYMFAEEFLGASDIIEVPSKKYTIQSVDINTRTLTDYSRAYKVTADNETCSMQLLTLTKKGILSGFNVVPEQPTTKKTTLPTTKAESTTTDDTHLMPLFEEQVRARTLREMAQGVAKQIYRIRETRLYILSGEIDKAPTDKKALELMLTKLSEQEKELTDLFIGSRKITQCSKQVTVMPSKTEQKNLFYFSNNDGFVNDEKATPIVLNITAHKQVLGAAKGKVNKKAPQPSQIYYNLPGACELSISYNGEVLTEKTLQIAQFGVAIPLAQNLFTNGNLPKIIFNPTTGNIESISK